MEEEEKKRKNDVVRHTKNCDAEHVYGPAARDLANRPRTYLVPYHTIVSLLLELLLTLTVYVRPHGAPSGVGFLFFRSLVSHKTMRLGRRVL
jgi:hypothetical protein